MSAMTDNGKGRGADGPARIRMGSNVAISVVAAAALLLMANYLAMRHYVRADWTSSGLYTLSEKTAKVLEGLDRDVSMHVLWSQGDPRFTDAKEILDGYAGLSSRLKVEIVDPDMSPERVQMIVDKYGAKIRADMAGNVGIEAGVFVVSGDNVKFVSAEEFEDRGGDMLMEDPAAGGEGMSEFKAEQELTSAIMRVTSDRQATVCFTQGHGEWQMEGFGGRALGHVRDGLRQDSYKVEPIATAGAGAAPERCALVVVAGPDRAFTEEEAGVLGRYLEGGGRLLLLLDPIVEGERFIPTGLERVVAGAGIGLASDIMLEVDPRRVVSDTPFTFVASEFSGHDAVRPLSLPEGTPAEVREQMGAYPVVLSTARSLTHAEGTGAVADVLAKSSAASWGEVDLASVGTGGTVPEKGEEDTAGPAILAMASVIGAQDGKPEGRLAVVGDSDFLSEELFVNAGLFNRDFWTSLVGWLTAREDLISIAAKNPEHVRLNLTEEDVSLVWKVVIGEVILVLIAGALMWIRRRR